MSSECISIAVCVCCTETVRRLQIEASSEDDHVGNFQVVVTKGERVVSMETDNHCPIADLNANEGQLQCETFKVSY